MNIMNKAIEKYIHKQNFDSFLEIPQFDVSTKVFVVIPCYDEPDVFHTLKSLSFCENPGLKCTVLLVLNSGVDAPDKVINQNRETQIMLNHYMGELNNSFCTFHAINLEDIPAKHAGVGYARKIGMDIALKHWANLLFNDGIICSLDADALVEANYFSEIVRFFRNDKKAVACTIKFEHKLEVENKKQQEGIILYELYMRYYKNALNFIQFIPAVYTIGSCFAVDALSYAKAGGMNRKKAGEDFYFIQKLAPIGAIGEVNRTTIHLSGRFSDRVPFGTGPQIKKWVLGKTDLTLTYPFNLFKEIKPFYADIKMYYHTFTYNGFSLISQSYLKEINAAEKMEALRNNCSSIYKFEERFYHIFNAFFILKWLNYFLNQGVEKQDIVRATMELLAARGDNNFQMKNSIELLNHMRDLDRTDVIL